MGFKFRPTDIELVLGYLLPKLRGENLTADFIRFYPGLYEMPPSELCSDSTALFGDDNIAKHYFFTKLKRCNERERVSRTVGSYGSWHESSKKEIKNNNNKTIGFKKLLNFKLKGEGECKVKKTTEWLMHEFSLSLNEGETNDFVLCVIQNKKKDEEKGSGARLVLGLGLGSGSGLGRQLKIASVESSADSVDSGSSRSFSDNQKLCDGIYTYDQLHEEIAEPMSFPLDSTTTANENPCPAQDEETQKSKKMRSDPQFDDDPFSGRSGLIHQPLPNEDVPIFSTAATYETDSCPSRLS